MTNGKNLTIISGGAVAPRSSVKPFDDFAERMADLGELYANLRQVLKDLQAYGPSTESKLTKVTRALNYLDGFDPTRNITQCEEFCEEFEDGTIDDENGYRAAVSLRVAQLVVLSQREHPKPRSVHRDADRRCSGCGEVPHRC